MYRNLPKSQENRHSRQKERTHIRKDLRKNPTLIKELQVIGMTGGHGGQREGGRGRLGWRLDSR